MTLQKTRGREPDSSSQPSTSRRSDSRVRKSAPAAAVAATSVTARVVRSLRSSPRTIPALIDLALPKFAHPDKRSEQPPSPWIIMSEAPAPVRLRHPSGRLLHALTWTWTCYFRMDRWVRVMSPITPFVFRMCRDIPAIRIRPCLWMTYCSSMDTGDSPLVATVLPGCPYRITSYTGPAVADTNPAYGMQLHHPRFLELIVAPESARLDSADG